MFRGNEADLRQFRRGGPVSGIDAFFAFAPRLLGEAAELADDEGTRRRAQLLPQGADQGEQPLTVLIRCAAVTVGFALVKQNRFECAVLHGPPGAADGIVVGMALSLFMVGPRLPTRDRRAAACRRNQADRDCRIGSRQPDCKTPSRPDSGEVLVIMNRFHGGNPFALPVLHQDPWVRNPVGRRNHSAPGHVGLPGQQDQVEVFAGGELDFFLRSGGKQRGGSQKQEKEGFHSAVTSHKIVSGASDNHSVQQCRIMSLHDRRSRWRSTAWNDGTRPRLQSAFLPP